MHLSEVAGYVWPSVPVLVGARSSRRADRVFAVDLNRAKAMGAISRWLRSRRQAVHAGMLLPCASRACRLNHGYVESLRCSQPSILHVVDVVVVSFTPTSPSPGYAGYIVL